MQENARPLSADLVSKLRKDILAERLKRGDKLTEQTICEGYGVSRTPVREALKTLGVEGLIEMIPNRGAFVVGLSDSDIADLYVLRMQYEVQAVRWAIERRTGDEMDAIEESIDFMKFYTERGDTKRMRTINAGFHQHIAAASHSRMLIEAYSRIQEYIRYSSGIRPYTEADLATILKEHKAVFAAFKSNDAEAGALAMKKHIGNSAKRAR